MLPDYGFCCEAWALGTGVAPEADLEEEPGFLPFTCQFQLRRSMTPLHQNERSVKPTVATAPMMTTSDQDRPATGRDLPAPA